MKNFMGIALIGVGAYVLYNMFQPSAVVSTIPTQSTSPTTTTPQGTANPNTTTTPPTTVVTTQPDTLFGLEQELAVAASSNPNLIGGRMNAHQWNYFRNILHPPEFTGEQFGKAFPTDDVALAPMTVVQFVEKLHSAGLAGGEGMGFSGLGSYVHYDPQPFMGGNGGLGWGWQAYGPRSGYQPQGTWFERQKLGMSFS